jgi:hypothetical protein
MTSSERMESTSASTPEPAAITSSIIETSADFFKLPALPGNIDGEGNDSFVWLDGSRDWRESYDLPRNPSLRLSEGDFFFQLIRGKTAEDKNDNGVEGRPQSRIRFFHTVPKLYGDRALEETYEDALEHSLANKPVPAHIRKMEIELVQRNLPRYPSQTHRKKASFYPFKQEKPAGVEESTSVETRSSREAKFLAFYRSRLQARRVRIAERREKSRLRREKRERRRGAKEAKRRAHERMPKTRGRKGSFTDPSSDGPSLPTAIITGVAAATCASALGKEENALNKSQSTLESGNPSTNASSMLSSVGSCSDDELMSQSIGDDEFFHEELDYFYSGEKQKLQQVHSQNIEETEREQRERHLEAERRARMAVEEAARQGIEPVAEDRAQRMVYHSRQLSNQLETYRVRMALFLASKWAEEDSKETDLRIFMSGNDFKWNVDTQYEFLRRYYLDRRELREQFFPVQLDINENDQNTFPELDLDTEIEDEAPATPKPSSLSSPPESFHSSVASIPPFSPEEIAEEHYEPQVGVVPPSLQALILQAQSELRSRKVPEEHKKIFIPASMEASEVGRFTRLNEYVVEAYGNKRQEVKPQLPSEVWKQGQEQVSLPKVNNAVASNTFTIFNEAAALGKMKALKPQVVTNYDPLSGLEYDEEVDIDDEKRHKAMRTNYLTDVYVQEHKKNKKEDMWVDADLEEEIRYESLEEVQLPTEDCPVIKPVTKKMTGREIQDAIAQAVAESAWERRYRLERPHAEQRITRTCSCKYCEHANPFQTHAYRKRWLMRQGLWKEPEEEVPPASSSDGVTPPTPQATHDLQAEESLDNTTETIDADASEPGAEDDPMDDGQALIGGDDVSQTAIDDSELRDGGAEANDTISSEDMNQHAEAQILDSTHPFSPDNDDEQVESDVTEEPLHDEPTRHQNVPPAEANSVISDAESNWSSDDDPVLEDSSDIPKKPRRKRSFLSELGNALGLLQVDENDNSASAKARRLRREKRRNRQSNR